MLHILPTGELDGETKQTKLHALHSGAAEQGEAGNSRLYCTKFPQQLKAPCHEGSNSPADTMQAQRQSTEGEAAGAQSN